VILAVRLQAAPTSAGTVALTDRARDVPNSRPVLLENSNHLLSFEEPSWAEFPSHVDDFLSE
jgi:hypothetical protein